MAASLVEATTLANATSFANPLTIPVTATIQSGDVIVVALSHYRYDSDGVTWTVTGGGVSLTSRGRASSSSLSTNQPVVEFFTGTATGDADVVVTRGGATTWRGMHRVWVFRGVTETNLDFDAKYDNSNGTVFVQSAAITAGPDQVVVAFGGQNGSGTGNRAFFQTYTPATGWATATNTSGSFMVGGTASRIPGSSESHQVADGDASASGTYTKVYTLARLRIGATASSGSTGSSAATLPALTASAAGTVPVVGSVTATLPKLAGAAAGDTVVSDDLTKRLVGGVTDGMTVKSGAAAVASGRFASTTAGTQVLAATDLPTTPNQVKVSGYVKVDKTAGQFSYVGVSTAATSSLTTSSATAEIGHLAGTGIVMRSQGGSFTSVTLCDEAGLVDGDEYLVTLAYTGSEFANPGGTDDHRWSGWAEKVDGTAAPYTVSNSVPTDRVWNATPVSLVARTNSAVGTLRNVTYSRRLFAVDAEFGQFRAFPYYGTAGERMGIWTRSLTDPLRIVVFIGGTTSYGGWNNLMGYPLAGAPRDQYRQVIHALVEAGYTVITPNALHEGWGSDAAILSTLEAIQDLFDAVGTGGHELFYLSYSMGGIQGWRALLGRDSHPHLTALYSVAGAADLAQFPTAPMQAQWGSDPAGWDSPTDATGAELIATGTRVRSVIGTSDTNVPKSENHDLMKALYAGDPLFEELVLSGATHFQAVYWDGADVVTFFDNAAGGPVDVLGSVAASLPALTAASTGENPTVGTVAATLPALTAAATGDVTGPPPSGPITLDVSVDLLVLSQESQEPNVETDGMVLLDATVDVLVKHQLTPAPPPLGVLNEWPIRRQAHIMPALSAASPRYRAGDYTVERADAGRFHVFVDGVDVTYLRDSPLMFRDITESVQVGPEVASLSVPQMRPWDEPGVGDLAMLDPDNDARVEVVFVRTDGTVEHRFDGALATDEDSSGGGSESYTFQAEGALLQAAHENYDPPIFLNPTDPGWLIADVLNSVTHRRYGKIPRFTTGLPKVTDPGQQGWSKWQRAQDLLSKCVDDNGRQLALVRVGPWEYRLQWKKSTTAADWTVTKGAPGVEVSLRRDQSTRRDCIYGRGVDPEGGVWGNYDFPGLDFYRAPRYPMNNSAINLDGLSDSQTDTGNGITLWQRRMRELGFRVRVDGVMNSADVKWVRQIQQKRGITVDGSLGPQTWSATFDKGYQEPHFERVRRPLAGSPSVEPWLYNANGSKAGRNPQDNPKRVRHAMPEVDFGTNIWKRDAIRLAQKMWERDGVPAHVGTITLTTDPHEAGSTRFDIRPGDNVQVVGHRGDVIVQVAEVSHDDMTVTLTVDSKARDMLALDAILERDRDARRDLSSRTARTTDMSSLNKSEVVQFESESKAGFYPRTAINGGLWTVLPIFVSQVGVAKVDFRAQSPKAEMVVALFEKPITANKLASYLSDPLASSDGWYDNVEVLEDKHGLMEIFGSDSSPGGYWPRQKGKGPLTGRMRDSSGALYSSKYGGVVWVAVFTSRSTWVDGRVFPASGR